MRSEARPVELVAIVLSVAALVSCDRARDASGPAGAGACDAACAEAAPLIGESQGLPTFIVFLEPGADCPVETQRLETQLGFEAKHEYCGLLDAFAAELTCAQIAELRCDPMVASVHHDGIETPLAP